MRSIVSHQREKQVKLVALILAGYTHAECVDICDVSRATIQEWLKLDHVKGAIRKSNRQIIQRATDKVAESLEKLAPKAVEQLQDIMLGDGRDDVRLKAACAILDRGRYGPSSKLRVEIERVPDAELARQALPAIVRALGPEAVMAVATQMLEGNVSRETAMIPATCTVRTDEGVHPATTDRHDGT